METNTIDLKPGQFRTIQSPVDHEITIQRSRFIASLRVVKSRELFEREMNEIVLAYPKASHYCWAYRFNDNVVLEHSSDAGEPSGTAGRPILGALKKHSLLNIMSVVTRYYGGIKLGVKGLISAYSSATLEAIENSTIIVDEPKSSLHFSTPYDLYNIILSKLENNSIPRESCKIAFAENITGEIIIPCSKLTGILDELNKISAGRQDFDFSIHRIEA